MSKLRLSVLVLLVSAFLLAITVTSAGASSEVQFLGSNFIVGKGLVLYFKVSTGYDLSQLASLDVNGVHYELECKVKESGKDFSEVACLAPLSRTSIGSNAAITFGSYAFSETVKDPRESCYQVWDWSTPVNDFAWYQVGTFCQMRTALDGELIFMYSPDWDNSFYFQYYSNPDNYDQSCAPYSSQPDEGNGYYFDC